MPDADKLFLSQQHSLSKRHAVLEDDGQTIWLYLTAPDSAKIVTDVWVCNRAESTGVGQVRSFAPSPPPAPVGCVADLDHEPTPQAHQWLFIWSPDGEAVAVAKDGRPVAFVRSDRKPGCNRHVLKDGPWGYMWSEDEYRATFE